MPQPPTLLSLTHGPIDVVVRALDFTGVLRLSETCKTMRSQCEADIRHRVFVIDSGRRLVTTLVGPFVKSTRLDAHAYVNHRTSFIRVDTSVFYQDCFNGLSVSPGPDARTLTVLIFPGSFLDGANPLYRMGPTSTVVLEPATPIKGAYRARLRFMENEQEQMTQQAGTYTRGIVELLRTLHLIK